MFVRDAMTAPVHVVSPDTTLKECTLLLEEYAITSLPVVSEEGELVGVISEADVLGSAVLPDPRAHELPVHLGADYLPTRVGEAMTHQVMSVPHRPTWPRLST